MSEAVEITAAGQSAKAQSARSPLSRSVFRALWLASVASNVGTWMHNVGADWLMTSLAPSPFMVGLMQTAENAPLFLLALPAGALADILDRRRLLLISQVWMLISAVTLAILTLLGLVTPWILLPLVFSLGLGAALNAPAWQAIMPELVPRSELPAAVSLNSVAFNIARAVGPALGGFVVAAVGSWAVFLLNSLSFIGIIIVIYRWRRVTVESLSPTERIVGAMRAGVRYVRHDPAIRAVLVRTGAYVSCASALWATLPLVARKQLGLGAVGYGLLLGGLGSGAIISAFILPSLRRMLSLESLIISGTVLFAAVTAILASVHVIAILFVAMILGGVSWMALMSSFNVSIQRLVPAWVRARVLAIYLLVFFGSMAAGSALWGALANRIGISSTLLCASGALVAGILIAFFYRLPSGGELDLEPSLHWTDPVVVNEPHSKDGPVLITVEYQIDPGKAEEFIDAMREVRRILRRDGAIRWGLFNDTANPGHYIETFLVESWAEHMRQHARITNEDRAAQDRARSFHVGEIQPRVTHLIAEDV
jgi:MFS family permease/quinol monooxygenase YgiN